MKENWSKSDKSEVCLENVLTANHSACLRLLLHNLNPLSRSVLHTAGSFNSHPLPFLHISNHLININRFESILHTSDSNQFPFFYIKISFYVFSKVYLFSSNKFNKTRYIKWFSYIINSTIQLTIIVLMLFKNLT